MTMLNDSENSSGAAAAQEEGGQDFTPLTITEEQLAALAQTLSEAFVTNFVTNVFDARNNIIENGEINFQKFCEAQADAFRVNAQAADLMAKHLLSTKTSWGVQYFTKWRDTFERLSQLAIDPVLDAKARLDLIHAELNSKLDAHFPTINGDVKLRKLVPYLGTAWDFGKMGAALLNDDREEFSKSAAGFVGGELGAILGGLAIAAGLITGWPAVLLVGGLAALGSIIGGESETLQEGGGAVFDFIKGHKDDMQGFLANYKLSLGTSDDEIMTAIGDDLNHFLVGGAGADWLTGNSKGDMIEGGDGNDRLEGMSGNDTLSGSDGADILDGGKGNDTLDGGDGFDSYRFSSADFDSGKPTDIILDSDGLGEILFNGLNIAGTGIGLDNIRHASLGAWETSDELFRIWISNPGPDQSLVLLHKESGSTIIVKNWTNGDLGIDLPGQPDPSDPTAVTHPGSANADYINPYLAGTPTSGIHANGGADRDMIWGTGGDFEDVLEGADGDDIINGNGGKDKIDGGTGDDFISAFGDASIVHGGEGNDVIDAGYDYGFNYVAGGNVPIDENGIWKDLQPYFGWQAATGFSLDDNGDLRLYPSLDLADGFDYSGASVANGWSYRFWLVNEGRFALKYYSPSSPDGEDAGSGIITYADPGIEFTQGVSLYGDAGNDTINGSAASDFIDGGDDDDLISGGDGNDVVVGGAGLDHVAGGAGNDILDGGDGNDTLYGEAGNDSLIGGVGDDLLLGDAHSTSPNTAGGDDFIDGGIGNDQLLGQAGNDLLTGGDGNDLVIGGDGDDRLLGGQGEDELQGGAGNDVLAGGTENDTLFGEAGNDSIVGDAGADQLAGGDGDDRLNGGAGNDLLFGQDGNDILAGGDGDDELQGGANDDSLSGGDGVDKLFGQEGHDFLNGGAGNDELHGAEGEDTLSGGAGLDLLTGGDGNDTLDGGSERDMLYGQAGNDRLLGGAGDDYLDGDEAAVAAALHGQDEIDGGAGSDVIHGQGGDDLVKGGDGDDLVFGDDYERVFSGNDTVEGGAGNDLVDGGEGNDLLKGDEGNDRLDGGEGDDVLDGGAGNDILQGGAGDDRFHFEADWGTDQILDLDSAQAGVDTISFGEGIAASSLFYQVHGQDLVISRNGTSDVIYVYGYFGPGASAGLQFADGGTISHEQLAQTLGIGPVVGGSAGADDMVGTEGDDRLHGGDGDDTLNGLAGDDYLSGGAGNDVLIGNVGHDQMEGGTGDDIYQLHYGFGSDRVLNLDRADSGSDIVRFGPSLTRDMINNFQISGDDLMIAFLYGSPTDPDFDTVTLEGFLSGTNGTHIIEFADGSRLTASDFLNGADNWDGTDNADTYVGGNAANNLDGRGGDDTLSGLGGNDRIYGGNGNDILNGDDGNDMLDGGAGVDTLNGGAGDDQLYGKEFSGESADTLRGGAGDDRYYVGKGYQDRQSPDNVIELEGEGIDTVYADSYSYTLTANVENLVGTYTSNYYYWQNPSYPGWRVDIPRSLIGNGLDNTIQIGDPSWSGSHEGRFYLLDGGAGADTLIGTDGDETYVVDQAGDQIVELAQEGVQSIDTVRASYSYSLAWNVNLENVELSGSGNLSAWGNTGNNRLDGSTSSGVNTLAGGLGDDNYVITAKDVVVEAAGEGNDTVTISALDETSAQGGWFNVSDYANIENLTLGNNLAVDWEYDGSVNRGDFHANLRGDAGDNVLTGNGFRNEIRGGGGNDRIYGGERELNTSYGTYADLLYGESGDDTLHASRGGADLYGGAGNDTLYGGIGNDKFHYAIGDGTDTIGSISGGSLDRVIFAQGIDPDDIVWSREGNDLIVQVGADPNDKLIVKNYWHGEGQLSWAVDQFVFADGTIRKGDLNRLPYTNNPPETLVSYVTYEAVGEEAFSHTLPSGMFTDAADDTLLLSLGVNAPEWLSIDPVTGTLTGTPPNGGDDISVQIVATDSWGQTAYSTLSLNVRNVVRGSTAADALTGTDRRDDIYGYAGNDTLQGVGYADRLFGGAGDDTYIVDSDSHSIVELAGEGEDTVQATGYRYTLGDNVERLTLAEGSNATEGMGNAGDNVITGNAQNNWLDGATGNDRLVGGLGDDTYTVDAQGDEIVEAAGEGNDTIQSTIGWQLGDNIENLVLQGDVNIDGLGNDLDNVLQGNDGNNRLEGGAGADELYGGGGDDYLILESAQDRAYEYEGEGLDTLERRYQTNLVLSDNIENLVLGAGVQSGNGNNLDNMVTGNASDNALAGLGGDDELLGLDGNDSMWGGDGADHLIGGAGEDYLDGGAGIDHLEGGGGNDVYVVDDSGDAIVEATGGGTDQVQTHVSYALSANIENLFLMSSGEIDGSGNAQANYLAGNAANNVLNGMGGNDTIVGDAGNDTLLGGAGDDAYIVDADSGSDVVDNTGGGNDGLFFNGVARERLSFSRDGNDLLIKIDNGATPAIRVADHFLGGDAAIDYVQPDGGSMLTTAQINQIVAGGGGGYDQTIEGTATGEQLVGGSGKDLIKGFAGADQLFGMGGNDTLQGGDDDDYLAGGNGGGASSGADRLEGGAGNDTLSGEDGANVLIGGANDDSYVYGGGQDTIDNTGGGYDGVFFNNGILADDLAFSRDGDDLVVTVDGNANSTVRVTNHFLGGDYAIDFVQPASGNMLDTAAINALAQGGGGDPGGGGNEGNDDDYPNVVTGTAAGEQLLGTSGRDLVRGQGGDDTLFGFGGDDKFEGGEGNDYLSGGNGSFSGSGNDILIGGNGSDTLVGEDGNDMLIGGAGDDDYYYSDASGSDTIDNTGGGTDWVFMNDIASERLSFHQDGDDLLIRVDASAAMQVRVLKHFLGGDYAISYVQPGSGYAIPASQIPNLLTPLSQGAAAAVMAGNASALMRERANENVHPGTYAHGRISQSQPATHTGTPGLHRRATIQEMPIPEGLAEHTPSVVTGGTHRPILVAPPSTSVVTGGDLVPSLERWDRWEGDLWDSPIYVDHRRGQGSWDLSDAPALHRDPTPDVRQLDGLISAMAAFSGQGDAGALVSAHHDRRDSLLFAVQVA